MSAKSPLKLSYAFISKPNRIRASAKGANANTINLEVMISNSLDYTVTAQKIEIEIPVGSNDARTLSGAANLPSPTFTTDQWQMTSSGSIVTIQPAPGKNGDVTGEPIILTLEAIPVNETPSADVPITITEYHSTSPKISDNTSYKLTKEEADFPVTNFYADPAILYDLDDSVMLYWQCSDQGANYSYELRSDDLGWQPKDCLNDDVCYSCADGDPDAKPPGGVQTPGITASQGSFKFYLDVIQTDASGHRTVHATLKTRVRMELPSIDGLTNLTPYFSGQIVRLNWLAYNAAKCTVELDSTVIDDNAPTDTYLQGYPIVLSGVSGTHELAVTAHARSGTAHFRYSSFPKITTIAPHNIPTGVEPIAIAFTPDSTLALMLNQDGDVTVIDTATLHVEPDRIPVGYGATNIAITPDNKLALVMYPYKESVTVIDIAARKAEPAAIPFGPTPTDSVWSDMAITPDGTLALVPNFFPQNVMVIDLVKRQTRPDFIPIEGMPAKIVITPDGTLALLIIAGYSCITVIDLNRFQVEPQTIFIDSMANCIAITPDSKHALVVTRSGDQDGCIARVIDIAKRQIDGAAIPVGRTALSVAITPDSKVALVLNQLDNNVTVIDIAARQAATQRIAVGINPMAVAVAPNGKLALVVNSGSRDVTVLS